MDEDVVTRILFNTTWQIIWWFGRKPCGGLEAELTFGQSCKTPIFNAYSFAITYPHIAGDSKPGISRMLKGKGFICWKRDTCA